MSGDKIYFTKKEQIFLMEMLEERDIHDAIEKFTELLILEKANPSKLKEYLTTIIKRVEQKKA